jgi:hypothetical protein
MAFSFTQHRLDKLEKLIEEAGYKVRYEKGNFRTGTCVLERSKIIVVNKFSNLESKITALIELIPHLEIDETLLNTKQHQFLYSLKQK